MKDTMLVGTEAIDRSAQMQNAAAETETVTKPFDVSKCRTVQELVSNLLNYVENHPNFKNIDQVERDELQNAIDSFHGFMASGAPDECEMAMVPLLEIYKKLWGENPLSQRVNNSGIDLLSCKDSADLIDQLYAKVTKHPQFAEVDKKRNYQIEIYYKEFKSLESGRKDPGLTLDLLLAINFELASFGSVDTEAPGSDEEVATTTLAFDISQCPDGHSFVSGLHAYLQGHPQFTTIAEDERAELTDFIESFRGLVGRGGMGDSFRPMEIMLKMYHRIQKNAVPVREGFFDIGKCNNPDALVQALYQHVLKHQNLNTLDKEYLEMLEGFYDDYKRRNGAAVESMVEFLVSTNYILERGWIKE